MLGTTVHVVVFDLVLVGVASAEMCCVLMALFLYNVSCVRMLLLLSLVSWFIFLF